MTKYLIPDWALKVAGSFDWITPLANEVQGFTVLEYSGSYAGAVAHKQALEQEGIPCRLEGGGFGSNACVYTRPEKIATVKKEDVDRALRGEW